MDSTVVVALIASIFGAIAAGVPAYFAQRNSPSRRMSDTTLIVDSTGKVIKMYQGEIARLDQELTETRQEIRALQLELSTRPTKSELLVTVTDLTSREERLKGQIKILRDQVKALGGTPANGG